MKRGGSKVVLEEAPQSASAELRGPVVLKHRRRDAENRHKEGPRRGKEQNEGGGQEISAQLKLSPKGAGALSTHNRDRSPTTMKAKPNISKLNVR